MATTTTTTSTYQPLDDVSLQVNDPPQYAEHDAINTNATLNDNAGSNDNARSNEDKDRGLERKLLGVFAVAASLSIFLWFMTGAGYPWFIYIVYTMALINCIIYGVKTKNYFFINWTIYANTNIMLFLTFLASGGGFPWFIYPACSMAIFPVTQYCYKHFPSPLRWLYIHAAIYTLINSMLFITWMTNSLNDPYPWFIYPWGGWGILLLIQYNHVVMHDKSKLFVLISADLGVMLLITFRFAIGPVFMVFVLLAIIAAAIYYIFLKKGYGAHCWCFKRNQQPGATTTNQPEAQAPGTQFAQQGFFANLPTFSFQMQPPTAPAPQPEVQPQGQPIYFQGQQYYAANPTGLYPAIPVANPRDGVQ